VFGIAQKAVEKARNGGGSSMIFVDTYRWREHCGPNYDNDLGYRTLEEFEEWKARCPVHVLEKNLIDKGIVVESEIESIKSSIGVEIREAFSLATSAEFPEAKYIGQNVYAQ
jgi:TPP-dependent pyruvate/acetoin dehydrogenase alpha subunit